MIEKNYFQLALDRVMTLDLTPKREQTKDYEKKLGVLGLLLLEQYRRNALWIAYNIRVNNIVYKSPFASFANPILGDMEWYDSEILLPKPVQIFIDSIENLTMRISIEKYLTWHTCYEYLKPMGYDKLPEPHEPMLYYAQMVDFYPRLGPTIEPFGFDFNFIRPRLEIFSQIEKPFILLTEEDFAAKQKEYNELGDTFWDIYARAYTRVTDNTQRNK